MKLTGKSVLVRHIVGLLVPDSGAIYYKDIRVDELLDEALYKLRKKCVYVFQHPTLFDSMSVLDNVALVSKYHLDVSKEKAEERARTELQRMGLLHLADSRPAELAMGEQKMVSLARALALDPETLILDEPTTGLDPYAAYKLDQQTANLARSGVTLLVISHDLRSIHRLAEEVVFLFRGNVRFQGPKEDFFASSDSVVRQFVEGRVDGEI